MLKIQELNEDQSPRLDDNGDPIYQQVDEDTYYKLINTPIGLKRWKLVKDVTTAKVPHLNGLIEGTKEEKPLIEEIQHVPDNEPEPGTILDTLDSHTESKQYRRRSK